MSTTVAINQLTATDRAAATEELRKFFSLVSTREPSQFKMFSPAVDEIWHELINSPEDYAAFLASANCTPRLRHAPNNGFGLIPWVEFYHEAYGDLPEIWFKDAAGVLNEAAYSTYLQTKVVVYAWDCSPIGPTMD